MRLVSEVAVGVHQSHLLRRAEGPDADDGSPARASVVAAGDAAGLPAARPPPGGARVDVALPRPVFGARLVLAVAVLHEARLLLHALHARHLAGEGGRGNKSGGKLNTMRKTEGVIKEVIRRTYILKKFKAQQNPHTVLKYSAFR